MSLFSLSVNAQLLGGEDSYLRKGNRAFANGNYDVSAENYQKAVDANVKSNRGKFNLGDALYQQEKYTEAAQQFSTTAQLSDDPNVQFESWHNLGNALLAQAKSMPPAPSQEGEPSKEQVLSSSIEAYKEALRLNPKDEDTRYNLAYAKQLQAQQQDQNQNSDQNNENQDQQNDQQQQNQDQQNQDQQNQDQQQQQQDQQQGDPQQSEQRNMSREEIERLLEALSYQEEKLQKELQKKKIKATKVKVEKDW